MKKLITIALILIASFASAQGGKEYFNDGYKKYDLGDYKGAVEAYTKCIAIEPNLAQAYFNRGHAKYGLKDFKGAIEDLQTAVKLKPSISEMAFSDIGLYKYALDDYQGSIEYCNRSIELNPKRAEAYTNRAFSKRMLKLPYCDDLKIAKDLGEVIAIKYYSTDCGTE